MVRKKDHFTPQALAAPRRLTARPAESEHPGVEVNTTLIATIITKTAFILLYNYKIVGDHFDKLTVTSIGRNLVTIEDKTEIARIISEINQSPRSFQHDSGFTYDYLQMGMLSFENDIKKLEIGFIIRNGNTVTKYWEIDTDFQFGKETE